MATNTFGDAAELANVLEDFDLPLGVEVYDSNGNLLTKARYFEDTKRLVLS